MLESSAERYSYRLAESKRLLELSLVRVEEALLALKIANEHIDSHEVYQSLAYLAGAKKEVRARIALIK